MPGKFLSSHRRDSQYTKLNFPFPLPTSIPFIIPHRIRRKFRSKVRSRQSPTSSITELKTSLHPADTLLALRRHKWSFWDGQYLVLTVLGIFSLCMIASPGPFVKTAIATLLLSSLIIPLTCQFFLPFLPIITWLVWFYACGFIPSDWRMPIWVRVLPALENILYGANLSNILSAHTSTFLSVLAWLPYGIMHFGAPAVCTGILFIFGPPGTAPVFARSFGYMNIIGVSIQLLFPCSPPWYENLYGLAPANYSVKGSPAGLAVIDKLFGVPIYTPGFTGSPMVFGAFPSLHAGSAIMEALFMSHVFPRLKPLFITYTLWLWWATMYLNHHYAVDLVGGSILSGVVFYVARSKFLPRTQPGKTFRWDYDYVEIGEEPSGSSIGVDKAGYILANRRDSMSGGGAGVGPQAGQRRKTDADEWTIGSSSSISSGSISPVDEGNSLREGETLGSASDGESGRR